MPVTCNIDSKGKRVRFVGSILLLSLALALAWLWAAPVGGAIPWAVTLACVIGGVFLFFEARSGWCALRAMGLRTPV